MKTKAKQGKANRAAGKRFELKVRADLESEGWIVFRNSNDVEFNNLQSTSKEIEIWKAKDDNSLLGRFKQAKSKWNPFTRCVMTMQSGFPDFLCVNPNVPMKPNNFNCMFVECKTNGYLDKTEKIKVRWIQEHIGIKCFIASKGEKRGEIKYETA